MADPLEAAIAAASTPPPPQIRTVKVKLGTGRIVMIAAPVDLDLVEVVQLVSYITGATGLGRALSAPAPSPLVAARGPLPAAARNGSG